MATQLQCNGVQLEQCNEIIKSHKLPTSIKTAEDVRKTLNDNQGILIDNIYYWVDKQRHMCVELYSRALTIAGSSDSSQWIYIAEKIPGTGYTVDIAHMIKVPKLDVKGEFETKKLSAGVRYEIFFDIKLNECALGWECPVTFEYDSKAGQGRVEKNLSNLIGKGRTQLPIGTFVAPASNCACSTPVTFRMYDRSSGLPCKTGLVMYGVIIKPALPCN